LILDIFFLHGDTSNVPVALEKQVELIRRPRVLYNAGTVKAHNPKQEV
jgi:hypothetical protein